MSPALTVLCSWATLFLSVVTRRIEFTLEEQEGEFNFKKRTKKNNMRISGPH